MRAGTQVAGSAIDRVFNPPMLPPRRFRGTIDAALTLALGSVCALGLTLGPAPMNTVALSSSADSSLGGTLEPAPGALLLPNDVDTADYGEELPGESFRPRLPASADSTEGSVGVPPSAEPTSPAEPRIAPRNTQPEQAKQQQPPAPQPPPLPELPAELAGPQFTNQATALTVVENYRVASGFGAFVAPGDCAQPVAQVTVTVDPTLSLPPGQAEKSLVPDPAFATVNAGPGALAVTIHSCK